VVSGQQLKFKQASAKVRAEGVKPFTKAFGKRMKQLLGGKRTKSKKSRPKSRKGATKKTKTTKSRSSGKKSVAGRKGTSGMTRAKKFLLGLGVGALFSTIAALTRVREIEGAAPIIDAAVGGGVEAQVGTAVPRLIRIVASRFNLNGNGGNGGGFGGA